MGRWSRLIRNAVKVEGGGTGLVKIEYPCFDNKTTCSSVYRRQFEAAAVSKMWREDDKAATLIVTLQWDASDVLKTTSLEKLDG